MLQITVDEEVCGLDDAAADELIRRVALATPDDHDVAATVEKLRAASDAETPAALDDGDLALIGVELEAWFQETDGDLSPDAEELRLAIARRLG